MADNTEKLVTLSNLSDHIEEIKRILKQVRAYIDKQDSAKVDKVSGKGLSTNDLTTELLNKLNSLENYDDTAVRNLIKGISSRIDTLVGESASEAIDNFNEILAFLNGVSDTQTLQGLLSNLKAEFEGLLANKVDKVSGKQLSTNDYTTAEKTKLSGIEEGAQKNTVTGVKGNSEASYRTGNVNLTPENIGAAAASHTHTVSQITDFTTSVKTLQAADILSSEPTETTLTHTVNDTEVAYQIGELVRVPDSSSVTGYKFYQLHNITDGKAIWAAAGTGSGDTDTGRSFGIEWSLDDTVKTINYVGDIELVEYFKKWVDESPRPCEIKKDGTDFAYLTNTPGIASNVNWQTREDGTLSHYDTSDKADYLQMVEMQNINIKFKTDNILKKMSVWFNFDKECPYGFSRWFKSEAKLFCRYIPTKNGDGYDIAKGLSRGSAWSLSMDEHLTRCKATGAGLYALTFWETTVLTWLQVAYYKTVDVDSSPRGKYFNGDGLTYQNGTLDSLVTPHGPIDGLGFRFMYMENCLEGIGHVLCAGTLVSDSKCYITKDDRVAQKAAKIEVKDADIEVELRYDGASYTINIDYFGFPQDNKGSSSTGFINAYYWRYTGNFIFIGANSPNTTYYGLFSRFAHKGTDEASSSRIGLCSFVKDIII